MKKDWNDSIEKVADNIRKEARGYKLMHLYQARKYNCCYNFLSITGIILGPLSSLLSGIEVALYPNENPTLPILVVVFGTISGILAAAIKFGKYDEMSNSNKLAAAKYTSLESNVRRQLNLGREDRVSSLDYITWLETKYEELQMSAPLINPKIYNEYKKNSNSEIPENYSHVIEMEKDKKMELLTNSEISIKIDQIKDQKLKRNNSIRPIPEINKFSDKMLEYELKRFIGFN